MGTPAPGNGGTNEGAATPKTTVRHKRGGDPKTDQRKEELSKQLGVEEKGTREPWRRGATVLSASCRGNCWWDQTSTADGVLSRRHRLRVDGLLHLTMTIVSVRDFEQLVNEIDYVKPQKTVSSSPLVTV